MNSVRILIADDHPVLRDGLTAILSTQSDFEVVGEAETGVEVLEKVNELQPDVILLDLEMPTMDGVETLKVMKERDLEVPVIVFTAFDTDERILAAIEAGAQGYLLKGAPRSQVFDAIRTVQAGGSLLQPVVASKLLRQMSRVKGSHGRSGTLTRRELEVLGLLARGLQNKEIAIQLGIKERTVKFHIGSILNKLDAGNRTEAVAVAAQRGLVKM